VAVAALVLWLCTTAIGSYLLITAVHAANAERAPAPAEPERVSVPLPASAHQPVSVQPPVAVQPPVSGQPPASPAAPLRGGHRYDPPSLQRVNSEPLPGLRDLAEFAHPALAVIGFGFWLGYVISRDRLFAAIGLGILLGAICAGVSWYIVNTREVKRRASSASGAGVSRAAGPAPLRASPRLLILHAAGAALTLLIVALIAARV
jgi:hypothetical protein